MLPRPLKLSAKFFIVFIDLATLLKSGPTKATREDKGVTEGEPKCGAKDRDGVAEGSSITALVLFFSVLFFSFMNSAQQRGLKYIPSCTPHSIINTLGFTFPFITSPVKHAWIAATYVIDDAA